MATYSKGIASTETGTLGLYQSWEAEDNFPIITAEDADGDVTDYTNVRREMSLNLELILDTTKAMPAAGATITLTDTMLGTAKNVVIETVKFSQAKDGYKKVSITAKRWPTNLVPN